MDIEVTANIKKQISDILVDTSNTKNNIELYDDWCEIEREDFVVTGNYTGHVKCVEAFLKLKLNRNVAIVHHMAYISQD